MFGLILPLALLIILILLVILAFEIWMFVAAFNNRRITNETRLLWLAGIILLHPFVAIAYYFSDYQKDH